MILNRCTTCGREPLIKQMGRYLEYYSECKCGKCIIPNGMQIWSKEVAADMWNRANPAPEFSVNYLLDQVAKYGLRATVDDEGLRISGNFKGDDAARDRVEALLMQCDAQADEIETFLINRLECKTT